MEHFIAMEHLPFLVVIGVLTFIGVFGQGWFDKLDNRRK